MFFVLSKIFSFLVHPFSWIIILIVFAIFSKKLNRKKWGFRIAGIAALFFTNTVIFCEFTRLWEVEGVKIEAVDHYDVAIVLGGMAEYDNNLNRLSMRRGSDRIWQALHLYHLGKVDKLMIVGSNGYLLDDALNEGSQFKADLLDFGIPEEDIIIETKSKNTYQNAVEANRILEVYPEIKEVLLVTSALHMRRSAACFEKAGFKQFDTFTTDHYTGAVRGYSFEQFILPNASNLSDWSKLIHEWIGYVSYWMSGYI
ncbi:YdcF family protein [Crocinitomix sp.]|nr:YdcF family protein [Crocinitomix sp.]